ncbi:MAG: DMT family transporter [Candidatus Cloacimonetes bacterium]|nr:DMT family transporter [Candidatus Cloacimonadota bacterium]
MRIKTAYLYALGAVLAWSTVSTAFKLSLKHLTPLGLLLFASGAATLFLAAVNLQSLLRREFSVSNWARSLPAGLLNPFIYYLMLFVAYDRLRAQEAQVLNYTWAIVLSLFSVWLLKERFRLKDLLALLLSFLGVVVISTRGRVFQLQFEDPLGSLLAVSTSLVWAFYWILNMKDERDAKDKLLLNFLVGTIATALYALIRGKLNLGGLFTPEAVIGWGLLGALYVGIFEMGFTFIIWQKALETSDNTASISNLIFLTPFISLVFIALILRENIHPATLAGLVVIVASNLWQKSRFLTPKPRGAEQN